MREYGPSGWSGGAALCIALHFPFTLDQGLCAGGQLREPEPPTWDRCRPHACTWPLAARRLKASTPIRRRAVVLVTCIQCWAGFTDPNDNVVPRLCLLSSSSATTSSPHPNSKCISSATFFFLVTPRCVSLVLHSPPLRPSRRTPPSIARANLAHQQLSDTWSASGQSRLVVSVSLPRPPQCPSPPSLLPARRYAERAPPPVILYFQTSASSTCPLRPARIVSFFV